MEHDREVDRAYAHGMQQACREIWQFVKDDDDAIAAHLKKLETRAEQRINKPAVTEPPHGRMLPFR